MNKFRNHSAASQQHEHNLIRHYETLLTARESPILSADLVSGPDVSRAVARATHLLQAMLHTMLGEEIPPDADPLLLEYYPRDDEELDPASQAAQLESLLPLIEAAFPSNEDAPDWAQERETEIARLEAENAAMRRSLGIDPETLAECGVAAELEADLIRERQRGIYATLTRRRNESQGGGSAMNGNNAGYQYWDGNNNNAQPQQMAPPTQGQPFTPMSGAPLQRVGDMQAQPGMRASAGPGTRRPGMFGAGRGVVPPVASQAGGGGNGLWGSQPPLWQAAGSITGIDFSGR
ncbi:unnamed protein product [Mycena citricolor]|nr:unnamed protein product [Mycena citricolor]